MFTPEDVFKIHQSALGYKPSEYERIHHTRNATYEAMARQINERVQQQLAPLQGLVCELANWLEEDCEGNYVRCEHETEREALIARAKQLIGEEKVWTIDSGNI